MDPITVSAQYAAYVWFTSDKPNNAEVREEANRFAQSHWEEFLPNAHQGLGLLLMRLAEGRKNLRGSQRSSQVATLAMCG